MVEDGRRGWRMENGPRPPLMILDKEGTKFKEEEEGLREDAC